MSTMVLAGHDVEVDGEGFMTKPDEWTPEVAEEIARSVGIDPLTERHWAVIEFCRKDAAEKGEPPGVRRITKQTDVSMKEIYSLFPKGPGILAAKISGLTKPKGCI
jgi:TusE/DsrC/DsvC family sulfur relay protein